MKSELIFKIIGEKKGYRTYYCIPTNSIKTGNEKFIMIVVKDAEIVYVPEYVNSQFKMKCKCDKFIESIIAIEESTKENYEKYFNFIEALKESHRLLEEDSEIDPMKWRKRKEELINKIDELINFEE